jgi:hypothetical protein
MVAVDDIGKFSAKAFIEADKFKGAEIDYAGDAVTMPEAAAALSELTGKDDHVSADPDLGGAGEQRGLRPDARMVRRRSATRRTFRALESPLGHPPDHAEAVDPHAALSAAVRFADIAPADAPFTNRDRGAQSTGGAGTRGARGATGSRRARAPRIERRYCGQPTFVFEMTTSSIQIVRAVCPAGTSSQPNLKRSKVGAGPRVAGRLADAAFAGARSRSDCRPAAPSSQKRIAVARSVGTAIRRPTTFPTGMTTLLACFQQSLLGPVRAVRIGGVS